MKSVISTVYNGLHYIPVNFQAVQCFFNNREFIPDEYKLAKNQKHLVDFGLLTLHNIDSNATFELPNR